MPGRGYPLTRYNQLSGTITGYWSCIMFHQSELSDIPPSTADQLRQYAAFDLPRSRYVARNTMAATGSAAAAAYIWCQFSQRPVVAAQRSTGTNRTNQWRTEFFAVGGTNRRNHRRPDRAASVPLFQSTVGRSNRSRRACQARPQGRLC